MKIKLSVEKSGISLSRALDVSGNSQLSISIFCQYHKHYFFFKENESDFAATDLELCRKLVSL